MNSADLTRARLVGAGRGANMANQGMVPVRLEMTGCVFDDAGLSGASLIHGLIAHLSLKRAPPGGRPTEVGAPVGSRFDGGRRERRRFLRCRSGGGELVAVDAWARPRASHAVIITGDSGRAPARLVPGYHGAVLVFSMRYDDPEAARQ